MSSADNLCNQFGPRSGPTGKKFILKKKSADPNKSVKNYPADKALRTHQITRKHAHTSAENQTQSDRHTDRHIHTYAENSTDRHTHRQTDTSTLMQRTMQTDTKTGAMPFCSTEEV